jgi:tetratricopeptide (TPR) repeat protein
MLSAGLAYYYIYYAYSVHNEHCFPLDDSWIHLTFARNIIEYGSYSYYKNEMITAGSTSPLYTLLLSLGYIFIKNEYLLSFSVGILCFSLTTLAIFLLSRIIYSENWLGIFAAVIFALDRWMNFFADSGMETPLYILLLVITYYYYFKRKAVISGLMLGLTMWARPDAVAFIFAIIVDYFIFLYFKRKSGEENRSIGIFSNVDLIKFISVFGLIIAIYITMNLILSGTILPNTFSAKTVYYTPEFRSRSDFLKYEVWGYFTSTSYSLLIAPFIFGILKIIYDKIKLKYNPLLPAGLFILSLIFLYWYKLPFAAVKGRYLVPIIPFYIIISVYGAREFFKLISISINDKKIVNVLSIIFFISVVIYSSYSYSTQKTDYAEQIHHISVRNLAAAKWINENTPENSVIASHDIGALEYYTRRKILDVAGLVSPQFTPRLFDPNFSNFMLDEMNRENVTYIAFIKEWYGIDNQNPLSLCGDNNTEIMAIYKYEHGKTHILSRDVNGTIQIGLELIANKQVRQAYTVFNRLVSIDPNSSLIYYLIGYSGYLLGDLTIAEKSLLKALDIFHGYRDATFLLSDIYKKENRFNEALKYTGEYVKLNPSDSSALKLLNTLSVDTIHEK